MDHTSTETHHVETHQRLKFFDAIRQSWAIYADRWETIALLIVAGYLLSGAVFFIGISTSVFSAISSEGFLIPFIIITIFSIAVCLLMAAFQMSQLFVMSSEDPSTMRFGAAFRRGWKTFIPYFLLSVLSGLVLLGGSIMLLVPAIIWSVSFCVLPWIFVKEDLRGMKALVRARQLVKGDGWYVFFMSLGAVILPVALILLPQLLFVGGAEVGDGDTFPAIAMVGAVLSFIFQFIFVFVFAPMMQIFSLVLYRDLHKRKAHAPELPKQKGWFTFAMILGILGIVAMGFAGSVMVQKLQESGILDMFNPTSGLLNEDARYMYDADQPFEFQEGDELR